METAMMRMRVYLKESDHHGGKPLYLALLSMLRDEGVRGATAVRGIAGYGAHSELHTDRILRLTQDLPVVVEAVDEAARIERARARVEALLESGMITVEPVAAVFHHHPKAGG
ncbi:MAG: DUF190 domain-containing protein [Nitrospirota bacterium]|nr:DUF190 domain-containing protein [Nitrospirota bacterium]